MKNKSAVSASLEGSSESGGEGPPKSAVKTDLGKERHRINISDQQTLSRERSEEERRTSK